VVWWCCGLFGSLLNSNKENSIVLKFGPTRRVNLGLEPGRVEEKTGEGKTWCDLADLAG